MEEAALKEDAMKVCDQIREIIKCLDKTHRNVNIVNIFGSGASVVSGVASLVGALLVAPPLAGIAIVAGAVGGVVSIGSNITEHFVTKSYISKVQKDWEKIYHKLEDFFIKELDSENSVRIILLTIKDIIECTVSLKDGWDKIRNIFLQTKNPLKNRLVNFTMRKAVVPSLMLAVGCGLANGTKVERSTVNAARGLKGAQQGAKTMGKGAQQGAKTMGKGALVLNTALLPLNVYDLYSSASGLISGKPSEASAKLGRIAEFLDMVATDKLIFKT